jgi:integrase
LGESLSRSPRGIGEGLFRDQLAGTTPGLPPLVQASPAVYQFTTETGGPLFGGLVVRPFKAALKRAKLPSITRFHDLRHTAATLLLADGVPLVTVSKVLGHSSPASTASIYAHALDESKASAIASLSARLKIGNSAA